MLLTLFLKVYPWIHASHEGLRFAYQLLYLLENTAFYSPVLHLLGQRVVRVTAQEMVGAAAICCVVHSVFEPARVEVISVMLGLLPRGFLLCCSGLIISLCFGRPCVLACLGDLAEQCMSCQAPQQECTMPFLTFEPSKAVLIPCDCPCLLTRGLDCAE